MKKENLAGLLARPHLQDAADRPLAGRRVADHQSAFFVAATSTHRTSGLTSSLVESRARFFNFQRRALRAGRTSGPQLLGGVTVQSFSGGGPFCRHPLSGGVAGSAAGVVGGGHTAHPTSDYVGSSWWAPVSSGWQGKPG